jgi:transcriptional regulator with XRE-family HTH domain
MSETHEAILAHIGPFIAKRRAELGLSLDEVAKLSSCTKSHIWELEQGRSRNPTISMAMALCGALRCSLNSLLGTDVAQPIVSDDELELIAAYRAIRARTPTS